MKQVSPVIRASPAHVNSAYVAKHTLMRYVHSYGRIIQYVPQPPNTLKKYVGCVS